MNTQECLSVLVSIIVGLGMSHLLAGIGRMVVARRLVRVWWVTLLGVALVFLAHVQWWWSTIYSGQHLAGNFFAFVFYLLVPIVLYLMAVLVLPDFDDLEGPVSLREHTLGNHRWFFGLGALLPLLNVARNVVIDGAPLWTEDRPFELTGFAVMLCGAIFGSARAQAAVAVLILAEFVVMVVMTSLQPG